MGQFVASLEVFVLTINEKYHVGSNLKFLFYEKIRMVNIGIAFRRGFNMCSDKFSTWIHYYPAERYCFWRNRLQGRRGNEGKMFVQNE